MGFFSKVGNFVSSKAQAVGQKVGDGVSTLGKKASQGYNAVLDNAQQIGDVAGKVSDVSGMIAKGATLAGGAIASTGIGLPLAGAVQKGARAIQMAKQKGQLRRL